MLDAMILLTWVVGAGFGGLWATSHERGDKERAWLYGFSMACCYFVAFGVQLVYPLLNRWVVLPYVAAMGLIFATYIRYSHRRHTATPGPRDAEAPAEVR